MKSKTTRLISAGLCALCAVAASAQNYSSSSNLAAQPATDCVVPFRLSQPGVVRDVEWGADIAWFDEGNLRRSVAFMGKENVEVVRASFQPTYPIVDGDLQQAQKDTIEARIAMLGWAKPDVTLMLNCDHPHVDDWYKQNAEAWAQLIDISTRYYQEAGYRVVSVSPFNEPDFGWNQWLPGSQDGNESARQQGFKQVAELLRTYPRFDTIRISGGNTLNCDGALPWYNVLGDAIDEGNTHQLAGSFDNFAEFFATVRADGKHATADEMHNVMEAMVGLEYGLQTGVWWGSAEYARGEFCKASHGERLGYAEHRTNWTAASVYRAPDGKVQAFGGMSERQGATTSYRFLSLDRDVFFNGHGPQREYVMELPGGEPGSYQNGQTSAEQVVNITWGDDVQPVVDGTYGVWNRRTNRLLTSVLSSAGTVTTSTFTSGNQAIRWNVNPIASNLGGDFSYHQLVSVQTGQTLDVLNWSLDADADIILYQNNRGTNQQWVLEYAGDGWFRIRSRHSGLYLRDTGSGVQQAERSETDERQLWRFVPTNVRPRVRDVAAPTGVVAEPRRSSVLLTWSPSEAIEPTYTVLRSTSADGGYEIIARGVTDTAFVDNKARAGVTYYYTVKAVDVVLNTSPASEAVAAAPAGGDDLVARYEFEANVCDTTANLNHAAAYGEAAYGEGKSGAGALSLDGSGQFVQLPTDVASHDAVTIATWMYWQGGNTDQHLFNFGNGDGDYICFTPRSASSTMQLVVHLDGEDQVLEGPRGSSYRREWTHVAVTLDGQSACLYLNGELVAQSASITATPADIMPLFNYIGRGQSAGDVLFYGRLDDFRVYNFALDAAEVKDLVETGGTGVAAAAVSTAAFSVGPLPADSRLHVDYRLPEGPGEVAFQVVDLQGRVCAVYKGENGASTSIDVSSLPDGLYVLRAQCGAATQSKKFAVSHGR